MPEEIACFNSAISFEWRVENKGWGLYFVNGQPSWLGISKDKDQLFIAKFVSETEAGPWHGYPADYRKNQHDIPSEAVLNKWIANSILSTAKIRKISRGQPCNL